MTTENAVIFLYEFKRQFHLAHNSLRIGWGIKHWKCDQRNSLTQHIVYCYTNWEKITYLNNQRLHGQNYQRVIYDHCFYPLTLIHLLLDINDRILKRFTTHTIKTFQLCYYASWQYKYLALAMWLNQGISLFSSQNPMVERHIQAVKLYHFPVLTGNLVRSPENSTILLI